MKRYTFGVRLFTAALGFAVHCKKGGKKPLRGKPRK